MLLLQLVVLSLQVVSWVAIPLKLGSLDKKVLPKLMLLSAFTS
jgi:hypothetical protein